MKNPFTQRPLLSSAMIVATGVAGAMVWTSPLLASQPSCEGDQQTAHVEIVDAQRGHLPVYHGPDGGLFVEGTPGNRYQVLVCNPTGQRLLAVVSVDGVNVVSGQTAAMQQAGYAIDADGKANIAGWRKSLNNVAAFVFTSVADSYAARTGRAANVGVIGVALFREKAPVAPTEPPILYQPDARARKDGSNAAEAPASAPMAKTESSVAGAAGPSADSATGSNGMRMPTRPAPGQRLGTGHGESIGSTVRATTFDREDNPLQVVSIRYDSRPNLIAMGVLPTTPSRPNPFPNGFVPDPPARAY